MPKNLPGHWSPTFKAVKKREINARLYVNQSNSVLVDVGFPQPLGSTARATLELQMSTVPRLGFRVQREGVLRPHVPKGDKRGQIIASKGCYITRELFEMMLGNGPEFKVHLDLLKHDC